MKLSPIVIELRARASTFAGRVAGAAEFRPLKESENLEMPAAYVIGEPDGPGEATANAHYRQEIEDRFSVVAVLDNPDNRGQQSWDESEEIREELWRVLLGWRIDEYHNPIKYDGGGEIIYMDRSRTYIAFAFSTKLTLGPADTRQGLDLDELPPLEDIKIGVDCIDPAYDPNNEPGRETYNPDQPSPRDSGPDGRIEVEADLTIPQE